MAKATPERSGDQLAGIAAERRARTRGRPRSPADLPGHLLQQALVPLREPKTSLIIDNHDAAAFSPVAHFDRGRLPRLAAGRPAAAVQAWPRG